MRELVEDKFTVGTCRVIFQTAKIYSVGSVLSLTV